MTTPSEVLDGEFLLKMMQAEGDWLTPLLTTNHLETCTPWFTTVSIPQMLLLKLAMAKCGKVDVRDVHVHSRMGEHFKVEHRLSVDRSWWGPANYMPQDVIPIMYRRCPPDDMPVTGMPI